MNITNYKTLEFRRRFWKFFGAAIHIADPTTGMQIGYIEMKAWVLKEDVRLYTDESKQTELFRIHARSVIDFGMTYDVFDSQTDQQVFSVRRKGLRSLFVRDNWEIKDSSDKPIGELVETSGSLALLRRYTDLIPFVGGFVDLAMSFWPVTYSIVDTTGATDATLTHQRNPFIVKFTLDRSENNNSLDPRIAIALTALLSVVDADKN